MGAKQAADAPAGNGPVSERTAPEVCKRFRRPLFFGLPDGGATIDGRQGEPEGPYAPFSRGSMKRSIEAINSSLCFLLASSTTSGMRVKSRDSLSGITGAS